MTLDSQKMCSWSGVTCNVDISFIMVSTLWILWPWLWISTEDFLLRLFVWEIVFANWVMHEMLVFPALMLFFRDVLKCPRSFPLSLYRPIFHCGDDYLIINSNYGKVKITWTFPSDITWTTIDFCTPDRAI